MGTVLLWIQIENGYMLKGEYETYQKAANDIAKIYHDCSVVMKPNFRIEEPISPDKPSTGFEVKK